MLWLLGRQGFQVQVERKQRPECDCLAFGRNKRSDRYDVQRRTSILFGQREVVKQNGFAQQGILAVVLILVVSLQPIKYQSCLPPIAQLKPLNQNSACLSFSYRLSSQLNSLQTLLETLCFLFLSDSFPNTQKSCQQSSITYSPSNKVLNIDFVVSAAYPCLNYFFSTSTAKVEIFKIGKQKKYSKLLQHVQLVRQPCKPVSWLPGKTDISSNAKQSNSTVILLILSLFPFSQADPRHEFILCYKFHLNKPLLTTQIQFSRQAFIFHNRAPKSSSSQNLSHRAVIAQELEALLTESVVQVQGREQIYNQQEPLKMNFGPPAICPPCFYFFFLPTQYCLLPPQKQQEGSSGPDACSAEISAGGEERIIVTKQDLLEEGYEQTKKAWTEEEDQLLLRLCANKQSRFEEIAASMPARNAKMCYSRFRRLTNHSKDCWSKEEDSRLTALVQTYGENWRDFQPLFPNRNYKQLKDHYENYLRPDLRRDDWTVQDDLLLIKLINQHGKNWKMIEEKMPGRSRNQLKNRYFGRIKRINTRKIAALKTDDISSGNKLSLLPL